MAMPLTAPKSLSEEEKEQRRKELERKLTRQLQTLAYEQLFSVEFWYRRFYNLPPSDPRYLNTTPEEMAVEYWAYKLLERHRKLIKDGGESRKLEDLLTEETFEEELEALDARLEAEANAKAVGEGDASPMADEEVLINFKAEPKG